MPDKLASIHFICYTIIIIKCIKRHFMYFVSNNAYDDVLRLTSLKTGTVYKISDKDIYL